MPVNTSSANETPTSESLLERCNRLLASITAFEEHMSQKKITGVDVKHFKSAVQSEFKSLQKLSYLDQSVPKTLHGLRSSNLPFYESVWTTARASCGLVAIQKRFFWEKPKKAAKRPKKKSALVDIVADEGLQWIKISTISESKLLFEKAKAGWEADEFESSGDESQVKKIYPDGVDPPSQASGDDSDDSDNEYGRVELVRVAQELKKASVATRIRLRHPSILIVLPNIQEKSSNVVDSILTDLRDTGAVVSCGSLPNPAESFAAMVPTFRPPLTSTVNLDCTILLALLSDLSHSRPEDVVLPDKPHPSLLHQVDVERNTPFLPDILYPGLEKVRKFVTSKRSAARMWEIVDTIGTPTERSRAQILFSDTDDQDAADLCQQLQKYSIHDSPSLPLPIEIIDRDIVGIESIPDSVLEAVSSELSEINKSVFLLGWTNGWTTVTSNKTAVKLIEGILAKELNNMQEKNIEKIVDVPQIWSIDIARSLVGKEGGRAT